MNTGCTPRNRWLAFAFYTPDVVYRHYIGQLTASLDRLGIPRDIERVESRGSWVRNCAQKPEAIARAMDRHPDTDIVYLDADAFLQSRPVVFDTLAGDLGVHYAPDGCLFSGTLYLRNREPARELVRRWVKRQAAQPDEWDQKVLQALIAEEGAALGLQVTRLPSAYCYVRGLVHDAEPVILQQQASCVTHRMATGLTFQQAMGMRRR